VTVPRWSQQPKHFEQRISTEAGIQIDVTDVQEENAPHSICRSRELDSNAIVTIDSQLEKELVQRTSTEAGIQIDLSNLHEKKALSPIRRNCEFDSNMRFSSDVQRAKHSAQSISIHRLIVTVRSDPKD
jgi:phage FluMu gp28-like protein